MIDRTNRSAWAFSSDLLTVRRELGWIRKSVEAPAPPDVVVVEEGESEFVRLRRADQARHLPHRDRRSFVVRRLRPADESSLGDQLAAKDDTIEKILRARHEWDPPRKRERRAHAPPGQLEMFSSVLDEEYSPLEPECEDEFNPDAAGGSERL